MLAHAVREGVRGGVEHKIALLVDQVQDRLLVEEQLQLGGENSPVLQLWRCLRQFCLKFFYLTLICGNTVQAIRTNARLSSCAGAERFPLSFSLFLPVPQVSPKLQAHSK